MYTIITRNHNNINQLKIGYSVQRKCISRLIFKILKSIEYKKAELFIKTLDYKAVTFKRHFNNVIVLAL